MEEEEFQGDFEIRKRKNASIFSKTRKNYGLFIPGDIDTEDKQYFIRNILRPSPRDVSNGVVPVQQFTLTRSSILKAIEDQAKRNTSLADKYLDVVIRNFLGEYDYEVPISYHEKLINAVLEGWKDWYDKCPNFRDSPLLYLCYICDMGWWRLHPFREHIQEHDVESLDIKPELIDNEFCMIACTNQIEHKKPKLTQNLKICSDCWKCGKPATFHNFKSQNTTYKCEGCDSELVSCTKLSQHESVCKQYLEMKCKKLGIEMSEFKICPVCFRCCLTQKQFDVHMIERHSVRSDDPISNETKICTRCKIKYIIYKYHGCPARYKNTKCEFCFRKFTTRSTQLMHMKLTTDTNCKVCGEVMRECMLLEHMLHHSKNYMLLHWCRKCSKNVLHVNEVYSNSHMKFHGKYVKLKEWSTKMLLPLKCVTGEIVDSTTIINVPSEFKMNIVI
ncbi:unnamed protein product [Parnassius mnemosyne]|uniref:C2H2-type domain-containing protein n=1 Tax=Parnassius mnemosyne TaxID=213953 RepID=A0AAV1LBK2_9NEOP